VGTDLNALFGPFDARVRNIASQIQRHDCGGPTYMHLLSLDHVFTSLAPWIRSCGVMSDRYGSDHAPLLARLVVP
jgi:endonuclease/exonuclease/phosphatase family metal-dependent hydrolase